MAPLISCLLLSFSDAVDTLARGMNGDGDRKNGKKRRKRERLLLSSKYETEMEKVSFLSE